MRYILQAVLALGLLVGLPAFLETPSTDGAMVAAAAGAAILVAVAIHGVIGYVRSRKPSSYHDSVMPPVEPPK